MLFDYPMYIWELNTNTMTQYISYQLLVIVFLCGVLVGLIACHYVNKPKRLKEKVLDDYKKAIKPTIERVFNDYKSNLQ